MKEFLLVFRANYAALSDGSPEEQKAMAKKWMDWMGGIAAQNKLVATGKQMTLNGKVVRANRVVTDGPYTEIKESLVGQCTVRSETLDEAVDLAKGCPVLLSGGNVEVRELKE